MSIKEKLPLLNSDSKGKRIAGYVLYAWIVLMVIGAILPDPDTGVETTTSTSEYEYDDDNYTSLVYITAIFLEGDLDTITSASLDYDLDELQGAYMDLYGHVTSAKEMEADYSVSPKMRSVKNEFTAMLDDYEKASLFGYQGVEDMDADKIDTCSDYLKQANEHSQKLTKELERIT